jgi:WD40 repeat protein
MQRFNPTVFVEDRAPFLCCALGGQDHLVSIWATKTPRAIVVLQNMFEQTVNDLAWTSDGLHLLMCSTDGTVGLATFKEGELGTRMPEEDFQSHIKTLYGDIAMGTPYRPAMVETPDLLDASSNGARQRNNTGLAPQRRSAVGSSTFAFSTRATTPEKTVAKVVASDSQSQQVSFTTGTRVVSQIMTSLPNGRKRIIPQHIRFVSAL